MTGFSRGINVGHYVGYLNVHSYAEIDALTLFESQEKPGFEFDRVFTSKGYMDSLKDDWRFDKCSMYDPRAELDGLYEY
jgi:hypothetical protein